MGWLRIGARSSHSSPIPHDESALKFTVQHVEDNSLDTKPIRLYPFIARDVSDLDLPFIEASEVVKRKSRETGGLWIVVDNIIYDCTYFLQDHPGGEQVVKSFGGAECSWQFWRFHGRKEMEEEGKPLRVGMTEGLKNRYPEPERYKGLRRRGDDDW